MDLKLNLSNGERFEFWAIGRKDTEVKTEVEGVAENRERLSRLGLTNCGNDEPGSSRLDKLKPKRDPWFTADDPISEVHELFDDGISAPNRAPEARVSTVPNVIGLVEIDDPETWSEDRQMAELYHMGILYDDADDTIENKPRKAPFQLGEIFHAEPGYKVQRVARKQGGKRGQVRWVTEFGDVDDDLPLFEKQVQELERLWRAEGFDIVVDDDFSSLDGSWTAVENV